MDVMGPAASAELDLLVEFGVLRLVDAHFARAVTAEAGDDRSIVQLALALASRTPAYGHVCLDLDRLKTSIRAEDPAFSALRDQWPAPDDFVAALRTSPAVSDGRTASKPLVLSNRRLYLTRYWMYQHRLVHDLQERSLRRFPVDTARAGRDLGLLFPECMQRSQTDERDQLDLLAPLELQPNRQLLGALTALRGALTIICGGPGTGKTTTVVRILAMLVDERSFSHPSGDAGLEILLLAPTGKAASRLGEAVRGAKASRMRFPDGVREQIPEQAKTIHRALGLSGRPGRGPRHDRSNPLTADVIVVDEASMVDLALMSQLFEALRPDSRLILLGDPDQLASVEAGAVLAEIVTHRNETSTDQAAYYRDILGDLPPSFEATRDDTGLWDCVVELDESHRFDSESGIGKLSRRLNAGDVIGVCQQLTAGQTDDVSFMATKTLAETRRALKELAVPGYAPLSSGSSPENALRRLDGFRVLTAHRRGPLGVNRLNGQITSWLRADGQISPGQESYAGRPVLITRNDPLLDLYNGDTGLSVSAPEVPGGLHILFPQGGGDRIRALHPARLPAHETVYAMTVHKSQGSEFDEVVLVLPERESPLLTRELLYTAITRARRKLTIIGDLSVLSEGIDERIERSSGLKALLGA